MTTHAWPVALESSRMTTHAWLATKKFMLERFPPILRPFLSKISNTQHHALLHKGLFYERPIRPCTHQSTWEFHQWVRVRAVGPVQAEGPGCGSSPRSRSPRSLWACRRAARTAGSAPLSATPGPPPAGPRSSTRLQTTIQEAVALWGESEDHHYLRQVLGSSTRLQTVIQAV